MNLVDLDAMGVMFPFEDTDLSVDEGDGKLTSEASSTSTLLDLGDLFHAEEPFISLEDTTGARHGTRCDSFCHARSSNFCEARSRPCIVKCMSIDEKDRELERLLEVLDRLVDSRVPDSPCTVYGSLEDLTGRSSGNVFLQEIYDIFCEDERVHVIHSFYERNLADPLITAWLRLPARSACSTHSVHLDPDGTFQPRKERIHQDVLYSAKLLAAEVTLGLLYLHERGIAHLDLRPENILVAPSGHVQISNFHSANVLPRLLPGLIDLSDMGRRTSLSFGSSVVSLMALVSDFGERERVDVYPNDDVDTRTDRTFGSLVLGPDDVMETTRYSAPELIERDEQGRLVFDENADWWSLGVILRELSYGEGCSDFGELDGLNGDDDFKDFLCQLAKISKERLASTEVHKHRFLRVEPAIWTDILDLRHPPCPTFGSIEAEGDRREEETASLSVYSVSSPVIANVGRSDSLQIMSAPSVCRAPDVALQEPSPESSGSDIQPFPSTASLYQNIRTRFIQDESAEISFPTQLSSQRTFDSAIGLIEPVSLLVDTILEEDEEDTESSIKMRTPPRQRVDFICAPPIPPSGECFVDEEKWMHLTVDEMVALSLLQARSGREELPGHQHQAIMNLRRCSNGIKQRVRKARRIYKASRRTVKLISRFIYAAVKCQ